MQASTLPVSSLTVKAEGHWEIGDKIHELLSMAGPDEETLDGHFYYWEFSFWALLFSGTFISRHFYFHTLLFFGTYIFGHFDFLGCFILRHLTILDMVYNNGFYPHHKA